MATSRFSLIARVFLLIGFGLLPVSIILFIRAFYFGKRNQPAIATVVEARSIDMPNNNTTYVVKVRYTDMFGNEQIGEFTSRPKHYLKNETVAILYDPENHGRISLPGFLQIYGGSLAVFTLGTGSLLLGLVIYRAAKRMISTVGAGHETGTESIMKLTPSPYP